jgi:hypothetical protein
MKNIFIAGFALFTVHSAFAFPDKASDLDCPNLTGTYRNANGDVATIKQEGTSFKFDSDEFVIDGGRHVIDAGGGARVVYSASCPNSKTLEFSLKFQVPRDVDGDLTVTFTVTETGFHESVVGFENKEVDWVNNN